MSTLSPSSSGELAPAAAVPAKASRAALDHLNLVVVGHVDHGKSTLIGRLLFDTHSVADGKVERLQAAAKAEGMEFEYAFLMDALLEEQAQNITMDTTRVPFRTERRSFTIIDAPGHKEFLKNMITGAASADAAVLLVDAQEGLREQTRRHCFLLSLLGLRQIVVAVNKMDLVDYSAEVYERISAEFTAFAAKLEIGDLTFIPISALHGDNVVQRSANMQWYDGPSLLHHLEHVHIASDRNLIDVRFPVQYVIRPHQATDPELHDYRGYAGQVAGGVLKPGDEIMHLPSGLTSAIRRIDTARGPVQQAFPPMSVTLLLEDDLDVSRGDMFCRPHNQPSVTQDVDAMVCWMADTRPLARGSRLLVKHTTKTVKAIVRDLHYRLDVNTLHRDEAATELGLNEIGKVTLRVTQPLFSDPYSRNRLTGGLILIDEATSATVGAAMISDN
jgi:bifunctional enzyme CysN/CysC